MKKELIFELKALYRDNMRIYGYRFGEGAKSVAIVGGIRGNELQQIYIGSRLVDRLKALEAEGRFVEGRSVLILPALNPYSINIQKRFWPIDNTDINRMFPGYDQGETTQRIAAGVFNAINDYEMGIHLTSNYIDGSFVPHVRIMRTGFENIESAKSFGLPYISIRQPRPYDTTTLNYNWQIWNARAYSILTKSTDHIDKQAAEEIVDSILNFLNTEGVIRYNAHKGYISSIIEEKELVYMKSMHAGFFEPLVDAGQKVQKGQILARILDPCEGKVLDEIISPVDGTVFYVQYNSLSYANAALVKLLKA